MSGITHVTAGALVGYFSGNPFLGFTGGIISHTLLDAIPHEELFSLKLELVSSVILAFCFFSVAFFFNGNIIAVSLGILGGCLPDLEVVLWLKGWLKKEQLIFPTHRGIIPQTESNRWLWKVVQVFIGIGGFIIYVIRVVLA